MSKDQLGGVGIGVGTHLDRVRIRDPHWHTLHNLTFAVLDEKLASKNIFLAKSRNGWRFSFGSHRGLPLLGDGGDVGAGLVEGGDVALLDLEGVVGVLARDVKL